MTITAGRARGALLIVILIAAAALIAVTLRPQTADAAPCAAGSQQHFYAEDTTTFNGFAEVDLPCEPGLNAVIKVASGGTHLGGEDPSFATANFAGFVPGTTNRIRVRVIGWHANTITGQAEFRYYSNKNVRLAVDVYQPTAATVIS